AASLSHDRAWLCVERAAVLEFAERHEEALESARRSLAIAPHFRPGVQSEAHLLQQLGREREALDRLTQASERLESGIVIAHMAALQVDLRHYHDARKTYERYAELSPLRDEETEKWLAARRADVAYYCGDAAAARDHATRANEPFYTAFAERLVRADGPLLPVRLDVPRAAAGTRPVTTLDLLAATWHVPAGPAPADIAPADGVHDPRERLWAEENGFVAVEFTVTPAAAFALIEAGVPFLVTMVDAGYSHTQLATGADRARHSLWLSDATERRTTEAPLALLAERYAATGPRGFALVPTAEAGRLTDLELPDRAL